MDAGQFGRWLMIAGAVAVILGAVLLWGGRYLPLGRLPGDIRIERDNFKFYFPVTTCVVLSIVISLILKLVRRS